MNNTAATDHPWVIRAVEHRDMAQLGQLTKVTYGEMWKRAGDAGYYEWKLFRDEAPNAPGFVAVAEDQVVGSLLSCRKRFRMGSQVSWAMERGDAMTHPDYRRQGMWQELMSKLSTEGDEQGAFPVMGFPAPEPFLGHKKKFSQRAFLNIWRMVLPLNPAAFKVQLGLHAVPSWLLFWFYWVIRSLWQIFQPHRDRIKVEKVDNFAVWADQLWQEESSRQEVGVIKDAAYLQWRFGSNPDGYSIYLATSVSGKPVGFLVTKIRSRSNQEIYGMIADLMVPSRRRSILNQMFIAAIRDFRASEVMLVDAWTSPIPFSRHGLLNFGFIPVKKHPMVILEKHAEQIRSEGWGDPKRWVIMMADSDNI